MNTSFQYLFQLPAPGPDTRDQVILDIDFQPLYLANPGKNVWLEFVNISGVRQNVLGDVTIVEELSARLLGNFDANNLPVASINVSRPGDRVGRFQGLVFSNNFPFTLPTSVGILIPPTFQLEFTPSNISGKSVGDQILVSFTFGYRIV